MKTKLTISRKIKYSIAFLVFLMIEVLIALYVHDAIVRPYVGDVLVVFVLYFFVAVFIPDQISEKKRELLPLWIFFFAAAVEIAQYFQIVTLLGLENNRFLRVLIGSVYDAGDVICYAVGCVMLTFAPAMKEKRRIPDALTISRIILSVPLVLAEPFSLSFYLLYSCCGISDMLDGFFARKLQVADLWGARLDSVSDLIFTLAMSVALVPRIGWSSWKVLVIIVIAGIRVINMFLGYGRLGKIMLLHTYANKLTGLLLFLIPIWMLIIPEKIWFAAIGIVALLASMEEFWLIFTQKPEHLDENCKGIWFT